MMMRSHVRCAVLGLLALLGASGLAAAEDAASYPTRPIHIIVPFAPGGASDFAIRLIQPAMEKALGQTLVIDNRTGAAGNVGMETAARAAPDGYTLFLGNIGTIAINPHFFPELKVGPSAISSRYRSLPRRPASSSPARNFRRTRSRR